MSDVLHPAQIDDYERDGHLILRGVLSTSEVATLRKVVAERAPTAYAPGLHYPEPGKYTIQGNQLAEHPALAEAAMHPSIVGPVEALLRQQAYLSAFVAYIRTPGDSGGGAHNDYKRWRPVGSSMNWLFAIVPLTDFDAEYGPLLVSPGSHKLHRVIDPQARILDVSAPDRARLAPFVDPELKAGDLLLMNMYAWHEPPAGTARLDRCGLFNKYCAVDAPPAAGHFRYSHAAHAALIDEGKRLLAVCSDRPLEETRLLIERPGTEPIYLLREDGQLPGGSGWEETEGVGWDVGARIGALQSLAREQLGVEIPWMSYIADVNETQRVYGYIDSEDIDYTGHRWCKEDDLPDSVQTLVAQWQRPEVVRGKGVAVAQRREQYAVG